MSDWQRLNVTEEQMEVLAHLSLKRDAPTAERLSDIWPTLTAEDAAVPLADAVDSINRAASEATGKPGRVIGVSRSSFGAAVTTPELRVHVMGEPYAEVR
ncbi:hypothetical protein KZC56_17350 [Microbacterium sp. SSW1-47]|uniref:hypothetical protein n=1 Tax=Microbacterium sufflavum TaxID=2851649 RepID=UPI001FFCCFF1|nr:hypothetical protein [Microbacterium sufflavum]MCK2028066.1 hypothetical protein [Microbacterium sufflavum]